MATKQTIFPIRNHKNMLAFSYLRGKGTGESNSYNSPARGHITKTNNSNPSVGERHPKSLEGVDWCSDILLWHGHNSLSNNKGLKRLLKVVDPQHKIPSHKYFSNTVTALLCMWHKPSKKNSDSDFFFVIISY